MRTSNSLQRIPAWKLSFVMKRIKVGRTERFREKLVDDSPIECEGSNSSSDTIAGTHLNRKSKIHSVLGFTHVE